MAKAALVIVVEFKNYRIGGAEMDRLVGAALRARWRSRPAEMQDIILFCRGYTTDAETRARELEQELNLTISFLQSPLRWSHEPRDGHEPDLDRPGA